MTNETQSSANEESQVGKVIESTALMVRIVNTRACRHFTAEQMKAFAHAYEILQRQFPNLLLRSLARLMHVNAMRQQKPSLPPHSFLSPNSCVPYTDVYTIQETAEMLGVTKMTIHRYLKEGKLLKYKFGYLTVRIPLSSIEAVKKTKEKQ